MVVSLYDIGCFIGAMSVGFLADPIGRERTLAIAAFVFIIGAILQAASYTVAQIVRYSLAFKDRTQANRHCRLSVE